MRVGEANNGADSPNRTDDLPLTRRLLYQLSYAGTKRFPNFDWPAAIPSVRTIPDDFWFVALL